MATNVAADAAVLYLLPAAGNLASFLCPGTNGACRARVLSRPSRARYRDLPSPPRLPA